MELLKKDGFKWGSEAKKAFGQLKEAMSKTLVLGLPDFNKPFTLETDTCSTRIGVVLMQEGRPLADLDQALSPRHEGLSI